MWVMSAVKKIKQESVWIQGHVSSYFKCGDWKSFYWHEWNQSEKFKGRKEVICQAIGRIFKMRKEQLQRPLIFLALNDWNPTWERKTKKVCVDDAGILGFGNLNVQDSLLVLCFLQEIIQMWASIQFKVKEFISEVVE